MAQIFHITQEKLWENTQKMGFYSHESLKSDGFIHFSHADQLLSVANSFFKGEKGLIILRVETNSLKEELKIEPPLEAPMSGVLFPHLYGELNLDAVEDVFSLPCEDDGSFILPEYMMG